MDSIVCVGRGGLRAKCGPKILVYIYIYIYIFIDISESVVILAQVRCGISLQEFGTLLATNTAPPNENQSGAKEQKEAA